MDEIQEVKKILHNRCTSCGAIANLPALQNDWKADKDAYQICQLFESCCYPNLRCDEEVKEEVICQNS